MGFFDKIKAAVGIGQPEVKIITVNENGTPKTQFNLRDLMCGEISVTAGKVESEINGIIIEFIEITTVNKQTDQGVKEEKVPQVIAKHEFPYNWKIIKPGESISQSFSFPISNARETGIPFSHKLRATVNCPGLDPKHELDVFMLWSYN